MLDTESKMQALDITITIVLFIIACIVGKLVMEKHDTWISFNGPAIGVLAVGELIWWRVRKRLAMRNEESSIGQDRKDNPRPEA